MMRPILAASILALSLATSAGAHDDSVASESYKMDLLEVSNHCRQTHHLQDGEMTVNECWCWHYGNWSRGGGATTCAVWLLQNGGGG